MSKNQCMTCRYRHDYDHPDTGKKTSVCVLRNYTRCLNHYKYRHCRLYEIQEAQQTLEA